MKFDIFELCKFPSHDNYQKRFLWTHKEVDLAPHPVVGLVLREKRSFCSNEQTVIFFLINVKTASPEIVNIFLMICQISNPAMNWSQKSMLGNNSQLHKRGTK